MKQLSIPFFPFVWIKYMLTFSSFSVSVSASTGRTVCWVSPFGWCSFFFRRPLDVAVKKSHASIIGSGNNKMKMVFPLLTQQPTINWMQFHSHVAYWCSCAYQKFNLRDYFAVKKTIYSKCSTKMPLVEVNIIWMHQQTFCGISKGLPWSEESRREVDWKTT